MATFATARARRAGPLKFGPHRRLTLQHVAPADLHAPQRKIRKHPQRQVAVLQASIHQRGFVVPILVDDHLNIVDGVARWEIALTMGLETVPVVCIASLSRNERRLLSIGLNKIPELAMWDDAELLLEIDDLLAAIDIDFTVESTGFSTAEIDVRFDAGRSTVEEEDAPPPEVHLDDPAVSRRGDLWLIGRSHRLLCGDACDAAAYTTLLGGASARMVCTDPPYNVKIAGHVSGLGKVDHREFVQASGEMTSEAFLAFLTVALTCMATACRNGAILFAAMDWRHMREMLAAGEAAGLKLVNLCVWSKTNAGMGSLYRSQHELFFVWKKGDAPHINNVMLGAEGRYRTNVWSVAGQNSFGAKRDEDLAAHPTIKPLSLVTEAIRDVSDFGDIVLDAFCGSGTVLISAERAGRRAYAMELDPIYVDVALRRFMAFQPDASIILAATGESFSEVEARRSAIGDFDEDDGPASVWDIL